MSACEREGGLRDPQEGTPPDAVPLGGEEEKHSQQWWRDMSLGDFYLWHSGERRLHVSGKSNNA